MDDAKRFLRYFVPGALFGLETTVLLWVILPGWVETKLNVAASDKGVGFAIAGLLGSGGVGFLLSVLHHELHWMRAGSAIDHRGVIRGLMNANRLTIVVLNDAGNEVETLRPDRVDRRVAQNVLSGMWHCAKADSPTKSADAKVSSLADTAHSAGTAAVASFAALVVSIVVAFYIRTWSPWEPVRFAVAIGLGASCIYLFHRTYRRVGLMAQNVIDQVFLEAAFENKLFPERIRLQANRMLGEWMETKPMASGDTRSIETAIRSVGPSSVGLALYLLGCTAVANVLMVMWLSNQALVAAATVVVALAGMWSFGLWSGVRSIIRAVREGSSRSREANYR